MKEEERKAKVQAELQEFFDRLVGLYGLVMAGGQLRFLDFEGKRLLYLTFVSPYSAPFEKTEEES